MDRLHPSFLEKYEFIKAERQGNKVILVFEERRDEKTGKDS